MSTSCCGKGFGSRFLIRHRFRQADDYNRLEPSSVIHLVRPNPGAHAIGSDRGEGRDDTSFPASASSGSHGLFLVPELQACDTLLPSQVSHRKGTG
jgi:hypothetical protein